jgi:hypothetical protein
MLAGRRGYITGAISLMKGETANLVRSARSRPSPTRKEDRAAPGERSATLVISALACIFGWFALGSDYARNCSSPAANAWGFSSAIQCAEAET